MKLSLSKNDILKFYDFLYLFETQIKVCKTGYNINNSNLNSFLKKHSITLQVNEGTIVRYTDKNKIVFNKRSNESQCFSVFKHIRNAFAHGLIRKVKKLYILEDKDKKGLTMYGRVSANLLFSLISVLEKTKKNY